VVLAGVTGCLPFTVSGVPEICVIVAVPLYLGFLISRWWIDSPTRFALAALLPLFGVLIRLLASSLHDGSNWFARLFRAIGISGLSDPQLRQTLLTLLFPVLVTIVATMMFMLFQRRGDAKNG
jgi:hypothetical protein